MHNGLALGNHECHDFNCEAQAVAVHVQEMTDLHININELTPAVST
jgi:hypothetical protein